MVANPELAAAAAAQASQASKAAACTSWYASRMQWRTPNTTWLVDAALDRFRPRTSYRRDASVRQDGGGGGLAVLLRGGSFRGSDSPIARHAAQVECARSVERSLVRPFVERGERVGVFLTVYDSDVHDPALLAELRQPFEDHVELVTTLAGGASEQILSTLAALEALLEHCRVTADAYETVVVTRFDMRFKASFAPLLSGSGGGGGGDGGGGGGGGGSRLSRLGGIRFLWHEVGH